MKILDILSKSIKPKLYEKGTSFMWRDDHISKQLLNIHLNPDIDLASRKMETIKSTVDWILKMQQQNKTLEILDLGCGPGLYSEIFAQSGHKVTGVDISQTSIDYAKKEATRKNLDISYINANYLELNLSENKYDLITLIYTDLGTLLPSERNRLLSLVFRFLKTGGMFVFDVLKDNNIEIKTSPKSWEVSKSGFWSESPYIDLSESFLYDNEKVILYQNIIFDQQENIEVYRFWTHFFSESDLEKMLTGHKFKRFSFHDNILPSEDLWNGDNVIFCKTIKE
jgi:ubiquinone/menaquinone biosynthesis C-methylase UbiE